MKSAVGLTTRGKLFYKEYNSQTYISRFTTQRRLEQSQDYKDLPSLLRTKVLNLWIETNKLIVHGV